MKPVIFLGLLFLLLQFFWQREEQFFYWDKGGAGMENGAQVLEEAAVPEAAVGAVSAVSIPTTAVGALQIVASGRDGAQVEAAVPEAAVAAPQIVVSGEDGAQALEAAAVLSVEDESTPPSFPLRLLYDKYLTTWVYLTVGGGGAEIRQTPDWRAPVLHKAAANEKLSCVETVTVATWGGAEGATETAGSGAEIATEAAAGSGAEGVTGATGSGAEGATGAVGASDGSAAESVVAPAAAGSGAEIATEAAAGSRKAEGAGSGPPEVWYHVMWGGPAEAQFGFVNAGAVVSKRAYRFDKMEAAVKELDAWAQLAGEAAPALETGAAPEASAKQAAPAFAIGAAPLNRLAHISNYKDYNGLAPACKGSDKDAYGTARSQAAPAYPRLDDKSEFRYLEDGTLLQVRGRAEGYALVTVLYTGQIYYVPARYVAETETLKTLERVVVVDRTMQNLAVFEKAGGQWTVVSYTPATTGKQGAYSLPTPLGYYYAMEKRPEFYYIRDGTDQLQGYAPYAIRFCGGAYIHGIGVNYRQATDGSRVVPGHVEYSPTIGTVPLSHKCVRNYTSHAKFLYDRYTEGTTVVAVID